GIEYQIRGVLHYHAILGLMGRLDPFEVMRAWEQCGSLIYIDGNLQPRTGFARVYEYDPSLGGERYVSKYAVKGGIIEIGCSQRTALGLQLRPLVGGPGHQGEISFLPGGTLHSQQAKLPL
ncbi:unnamed protein product, partial [marine sediment metagenome]